MENEPIKTNKTLEDIINKPNFGNLAKLVVIGVMTVGFVVSGIIVVVNDGDLQAYAEASKIFGGFVLAAITAGGVNTFGKSETAKTIIAQNMNDESKPTE